MHLRSCVICDHTSYACPFSFGAYYAAPSVAWPPNPLAGLQPDYDVVLSLLGDAQHNKPARNAATPDKEVFLPLHAFVAEFAFCNTGIITLPVSLVCFLLWSRTMASADEEGKSLRRPFLLSAILFLGLTTSSGKLSTTSGGGEFLEEGRRTMALCSRVFDSGGAVLGHH